MTRPRLSGEAAALAEYACLTASPIYRGTGAPRGDGRHVLVLPGLFGNDFYLTPLRGWLRRIGYQTIRSALALNAGCADRLTGEVEKELARSLPAGAPLAIIGHSRGGILGWGLASKLGRRTSHLILLGSPAGPLAAALRSGRVSDEIQRGVSRVVMEAGSAMRRATDPDCAFPNCECAFVKSLRMPLSTATRAASVASRDDAIVPARLCEIAGATNLVVSGTHSGLASNAEVYAHLAELLAAG
jgi:pimeloyl-ACP methyl ester carboxylesterase